MTKEVDRPPIQGDRPKEHVAEDRLGYAKFARSLASSIVTLAPSDGIVLALNGQWGSGKTSAINMVVEEIAALQIDAPDGDDKIVSVRFNPWWFSGQEDLAKAFFAELSSSIEAGTSSEIGDGFRKLARRLSASKELVVSGLGFVPGGGLAAKFVESGIDALQGFAGEDRSILQLRDDLCTALKNQTKRILVIIDDVDRLPADEIRQIFRLVKSLADLPNVIHLLIFDRKIAEHAFETTADAGPKWHEKIIQAAFDLPPIQNIDIQELFIEGLNKMIGPLEPFDQTRWGNVFHDCIIPYLVTPRDVGRLLNALSVSWPAVAREVDLADFVALETLRLFEPQLHQFIRQNPERLTGLSEAESNNGVEKQVGYELLKTVGESKHDRIKRSTQRLFPKLKSTWGNHGYAASFLTDWDKARRVCVMRRFPAYFGFGVGRDALTRDEIETFAQKILDLGYVRQTASIYADTVRPTGGTKAAVLIEELSTNIDLIADAAIPAAVVNLFDVANFLVSRTDSRREGFLSIPPMWRYWFLMSPLLERLAEADRGSVLQRAFSVSKSLAGLRFALDVFRASLGRDKTVKRDDAGSPLIDETVCDELEQQMRVRYEIAAADGTFLKETDFIGNVTQWEDLGGQQNISAWLEKVLNDDTSILAFAEAVTQTSHLLADGDRVVQERPAVSTQTLQRFVDLGKMLARLKEVASSTLNANELAIIKNFERGVEGFHKNALEEVKRDQQV